MLDFIDPIYESFYKVLSRNQKLKPFNGSCIVDRPSKIHHFMKSNFTFAVKQLTLNTFARNTSKVSLQWRIVIKAAVNKEKTIYHFTTKLSGVSYFTKARAFL